MPVSGLEVRVLHRLADLEEVYRLIDEIWRPGPGAAPVQVEMMRALSHAGNYIAGAYEDGRMVGTSVAFLSDPPGHSLHSHITGAAAGRGIGLALKAHQRDWALARGLSRITWTYDPLVRRNAYFNLVKLGARPEEYLASFYGEIEDSINGGDETDRVMAVWPLDEPRVAAAVRGAPAVPEVPEGTPDLLAERDGRPVLCETDAPTVLVTIPGDIEGLRKKDRGAAREWRLAVREVLGGLLASGARVTGFHDRTAYVVDRSTVRGEPRPT